MNLQGIVARSGQAFKYILDPNVDLISAPQAAQLAEIKRQLAEAKRRLEEDERASREKNALIAQLREELAVKPEPAPAQSPKRTRRRKTTPKTPVEAKSAMPAKKPAVRKGRSASTRGNSSKAASKGNGVGKSTQGKRDPKN